MPSDMQTRCALPGTDPQLFFQDLVEKIRRNASSASSMYSAMTDTGSSYTLTPPMLYWFMTQRLAHSPQGPWLETLELLNQLGGDNEAIVINATVRIFQEICPDDWKHYAYCYLFMDYVHNADFDGTLTENAARGLDYAGVYSAVGAKGFFKEFKGQYGPAPLFFGTNKAGYGLLTWAPLPTPAEVGSRTGLRMLLVNDLFDRATPWSSAKQMRNAFPDAHLMTWQGVGHMVTYSEEDYDPEGVLSCVERISDFLLKDVMPPEGFTCRQTRKFTW